VGSIELAGALHYDQTKTVYHVDAASLETSMLTGKLGLILLLELALALGSMRAAQQTAGSPASTPREQTTPQAAPVLEEGTRVQLMLAETLDTERRGGRIEGVKFQVFPEVRVGDLVLIERGAYAWGSAEMERKASFGRNGSVRITSLRVLAITGVEVPLRGDANQEGLSPCFDVVGCIFGVAGGDAVMSRGTKVKAYVAKNVSLDTAAVKKAMAEAQRKKALERIAHRDLANVYIYRMSYDLDDPNEIVATRRDKILRNAAPTWGPLSGLSSVYVDGHEVVRIPEYRFIALTFMPGKHVFAADKSDIELDLVGSGDYYLRLSGGSKKQLKLVSSDEGEEQIYPMYPVSEALSEP
jgi:hypothetical protein